MQLGFIMLTKHYKHYNTKMLYLFIYLFILFNSLFSVDFSMVIITNLHRLTENFIIK